MISHGLLEEKVLERAKLAYQSPKLGEMLLNISIRRNELVLSGMFGKVLDSIKFEENSSKLNLTQTREALKDKGPISAAWKDQNQTLNIIGMQCGVLVALPDLSKKFILDPLSIMGMSYSNCLRNSTSTVIFQTDFQENLMVLRGSKLKKKRKLVRNLIGLIPQNSNLTKITHIEEFGPGLILFITKECQAYLFDYIRFKILKKNCFRVNPREIYGIYVSAERKMIVLTCLDHDKTFYQILLFNFSSDLRFELVDSKILKMRDPRAGAPFDHVIFTQRKDRALADIVASTCGGNLGLKFFKVSKEGKLAEICEIPDYHSKRVTRLYYYKGRIFSTSFDQTVKVLDLRN